MYYIPIYKIVNKAKMNANKEKLKMQLKYREKENRCNNNQR